MELVVNGENTRLKGPLTVEGLLKVLGIDPETVVVELNLKILKREDHREEALNSGDTIEIIQMVDGG
jgi:sulfur carrier protein